MSLCEFDRRLAHEHSADFLIGVDEAGRGPLAGPVVACAVFVPLKAHVSLSEIKDSKLLSEEKREMLFALMRSLGVKFGAGFASPSEIDRVNILQATFLAMRRAVSRLCPPPFSSSTPRGGGKGWGGKCGIRVNLNSSLVVVDGPYKIPGLELSQTAVVDADAKSLSAACAGICAKVLRDRWMKVLDGSFPGYGFALHKGYGTRVHMEALRKLGPSPVHRRSFAPVAKYRLKADGKR